MRMARSALQCGHGRRPWRTAAVARAAEGYAVNASMRPRPKAVENHLERWRIIQRLSLQCGHGPKAVENCIAPMPARASERLQWGHGRRPWRTARLSTPYSSASAGFNAATARRPWRTQPLPQREPCPLHGFNGATARRPWRTCCSRRSRNAWHVALQWGHGPKTVENPRSLRHGMRRSCKASMRPRPEDRGEPRLPIRTTPPVQDSASMRPRPEDRGELLEPRRVQVARSSRLQCGHGPKTVENHASVASDMLTVLASMGPRPEGRGEPMPVQTAPSPSRSRLQWGHGPKAVENSNMRRLTHGNGRLASMGPRPEGRGERRLDNVRTRDSSRASMGPRPEGRGERRRRRQSTAADRGFNGATARRPWRTCRPGDVDRRRVSFNGATARRPWRTRASSGTPCGSEIGFNGATATKTVENVDRRVAHRRRRRCCFNGATARRPWRTLDATWPLYGGQCGFNGATARRPWRTAMVHDSALPRIRRFNGATARRPWRTRRRPSQSSGT